ncbi:uncharacterized protein J3D65DRAFT_675461 [Phyllosticta citribraziliensis]|uniref:Peptidase M43 pregnancy-associated plasma-A domain-containing protein n=1 Tax=Phyllosticta citribraziliensis TaxID=989973 RepID=A0ABR1LZ06_9PEZI
MQSLMIFIAAFLAWAPLTMQTRFCGTTYPSKEALDAIYVSALLEEAIQPADGVSDGPDEALWTDRPAVSVYFHVVDDFSEFQITDSHFWDQFLILRDFYTTVGIDLELKQILFYNYRDWSTGRLDQTRMIKHLRIGAFYTLNVFFVENIWDGGDDDTLGLTPLPQPDAQWGSDALLGDGVMLSIETLPGDSRASDEAYNMGRSLLHEVGHWFGLMHIFHDGCDPDFEFGGDKVLDTPPQPSSSEDCFDEGTTRQTCPDGFPRSMTGNLMDYQDDICTYGFTPGQIKRMHSTWILHRVGRPFGTENMPADPFAPKGNPARILPPVFPELPFPPQRRHANITT